MNIAKALDKSWEGKSLGEIVNAPVAALQGVSDADAQALDAAFGVKTVGDLGRLKFARWAQAIVTLAEVEG